MATQTKSPSTAEGTAIKTELVTLAELCTKLKLEPRLARRALRKAKMKVDGARWEWKRESEELPNVMKVLKAAKA